MDVCLAAILCSVVAVCSGAAGDLINGTDRTSFAERRDTPHRPPAAEILASLLQRGVLDVDGGSSRRAGSAGEDPFMDNKYKMADRKSPVSPDPASSASPNSQANRMASMDTKPGSSGSPGEVYANEKSPSRSLLTNVEPVTGYVWPVGQGTVGSDFRKSFAKAVAESQEDSGSGDPHAKVTRPADSGWNLRDFMDVATSAPSQTSTAWSHVMPSTEKAISPDSAEVDLLLQVSRETSVQSPSPPGTDQSHREAGRSQGAFLEKESAERGAHHITGVTQVDASSTAVPPNRPPRPSEPPSGDPADIDYRDPSDLDHHFPPGGDSTKGFHDKLGPWHKHLHYDDFSPFDYLYPTPPFYADGYEEGGIEDEDDDLEDVEDDDVTPKDVPKVATPKILTSPPEEKPTGRQDFPFRGETFPKHRPEGNKDQTQSGTGDNATECRSGYVRRNNSCRSLCDIYPTYCYNGGQCYMVENIGAFCRCNTQDYIWHKGLRCESIITDFQVMCVAVGAAALVVLLLFMMTVFFAKKLYLLKTENYKLRKRNRYRTPSELHNDNFSLSTIAEGSHPNEDPNAPQKVQDLPKACLKDEEPFNIQNSLSPKHECSKGDPDIVDVNCVLNNLT